MATSSLKGELDSAGPLASTCVGFKRSTRPVEGLLPPFGSCWEVDPKVTPLLAEDCVNGLYDEVGICEEELGEPVWIWCFWVLVEVDGVWLLDVPNTLC